MPADIADVALAAQDRRPEAIDAYEKGARIWSATNDATGNLRAAECYALCAGLSAGSTESAARARFTKEAVAALRRAIDGGFHDAEELKTDPSFAAIRGVEDFRQLFSRLPAPPSRAGP